MSLPIAYLHECLECDESTGILTWRDRPKDLFKNEMGWRGFQGFVGKPATSLSNGYFRVRLNGRLFVAHKVVFAMVCGRWPVDELDHINGRRDDNRISNLREVSRRENCRNVALRSNNTSGVLGVYWKKDTKKWVAQIKANGKVRVIGAFANKDDASAARKKANETYGFHPNHGRAA